MADGEELEDPKLEQAVFGREVEHFIEADSIGVYLVARARQELEEVKEKLLTCDPANTEEIRRLQGRAGICTRFRDWLGEAVAAGFAAQESLQQERDEQQRT